jgi:DNA polymerase III delta prime subunit
MRFNQLPEGRIIEFLDQINVNEKLKLSIDTLRNIQTQFGSDIRGMINYMQSNQIVSKCKIIHRNTWNDVIALETSASISSRLNRISRDYCIEKKSMMVQFLNHIIRTQLTELTPEFLTHIEYVIHNQECNSKHIVEYISLAIMKWKKNKVIKSHLI